MSEDRVANWKLEGIPHATGSKVKVLGYGIEDFVVEASLGQAGRISYSLANSGAWFDHKRLKPTGKTATLEEWQEYYTDLMNEIDW